LTVDQGLAETLGDPRSYFDGSSPHASWDGTADASTSTQAASSWRIDYLYDEDGAPYGGVYRSPHNSSSPTFFSMITTDRGDVVELLDRDGDAFAAYRYDEWGNPLGSGSHAPGIWTQATNLIDATTAGEIADRQILRYAGYAYDAESGLYYCSARYYDPVTRQWTTKDEVKADGEESAYQYCGGVPVCLVDPSGFDNQTSNSATFWRTVSSQWKKAGVDIADMFRKIGKVIDKGVIPGMRAFAPFYTQFEDVCRGKMPSLSSGLVEALAITPVGKFMKFLRIAKVGKAAERVWKWATRAVRAEKGVDDVGRLLYDSWYRSSFPNKMQSLRYHYRVHVVKDGIKKSMTEYTQDANDLFHKYAYSKEFARDWPIKDGKGTKGIKITLGSGKRGGIFTSSGQIVSFWYK